MHEQLIVVQLVSDLTAFCGNRMFIIDLTKALLCHMKPVHIPISPLRSILIFLFHFRRGLPSDLLLWVFLTKILYLFLISSMRVTCPCYLCLLDFIALIIYSDSGLQWNRWYRCLPITGLRVEACKQTDSDFSLQQTAFRIPCTCCPGGHINVQTVTVRQYKT